MAENTRVDAAGSPAAPVSRESAESRGALLRLVGGELAARGLKVRDFRFDRLLSLIEVSNPADPARGTVSVGLDGNLFWERLSPSLSDRAAAGRAAEEVFRLLADDSASPAGSDGGE
jgi:hypothetical protein